MPCLYGNLRKDIYMEISYRTGVVPATQEIISVLDSSGIRRPTSDPERITQMFRCADLVVTAWEGDLLVGLARSLTDFCYCCYLSDLAVRAEYQRRGIGRELIARTRAECGEGVTLILVSAPTAMTYYPAIGMERLEGAFGIRRTR